MSFLVLLKLQDFLNVVVLISERLLQEVLYLLKIMFEFTLKILLHNFSSKN